MFSMIVCIGTKMRTQKGTKNQISIAQGRIFENRKSRKTITKIEFRLLYIYMKNVALKKLYNFGLITGTVYQIIIKDKSILLENLIIIVENLIIIDVLIFLISKMKIDIPLKVPGLTVCARALYCTYALIFLNF